MLLDRKSTRLNSSHTIISYAVFCLKKKKKKEIDFTLGCNICGAVEERLVPLAAPHTAQHLCRAVCLCSLSVAFCFFFFFFMNGAPPDFPPFPPPPPFPI